MSQLEDELIWQVKAAKLPAPVREVTPIKGRRFRFDLCWPDQMLACEVQGGVHSGGRHVRGVGAESDAEKLTLAVLAGYRVLVVTAKHIKSGQALSWIEAALQVKS